MDKFLNSLLAGSNNPPEGTVVFDSSDHIRFQNGQNVSGHNYGCNRRLVIEKNIQGDEGYTVTMYNLDCIHPLWQNNVQMAPKRMRIINVDSNIIQLRGYGFDMMEPLLQTMESLFLSKIMLYLEFNSICMTGILVLYI